MSEEKKEDGPRLGIFDGIPNEEYHRCPGISKSGLDVINRTAAHYIVYKQHPKPSTNTFTIGDGLHAAVLQPEPEGSVGRDPRRRSRERRRVRLRV